ncbi:MAG: hypothetical protein WBY53_16210 [Acidobacteriaceae bacterium]
MAVTKKSITKSSTARKPVTTKAPKSTAGSTTAPAGKMVTALRMAKTVTVARTAF